MSNLYLDFNYVERHLIRNFNHIKPIFLILSHFCFNNFLGNQTKLIKSRSKIGICRVSWTNRYISAKCSTVLLERDLSIYMYAEKGSPNSHAQPILISLWQAVFLAMSFQQVKARKLTRIHDSNSIPSLCWQWNYKRFLTTN